MSIITLYSEFKLEDGESVVMDATSLQPRPFDEATDSPLSIIGVVYPKYNTSGRTTYLADGPCFYDKDSFEWTELLERTENTNPDFDLLFSPVIDPNYYFICLTGLSGVLNSAAKNPNWIFVKPGTVASLFFIK